MKVHTIEETIRTLQDCFPLILVSEDGIFVVTMQTWDSILPLLLVFYVLVELNLLGKVEKFVCVCNLLSLSCVWGGWLGVFDVDVAVTC